MGVVNSRTGRESTEIGVNQVTNNSNFINDAPNNNLPNSRLNLIYNQISSNKIKKKKSRNELFNVSFSAYFYIAGRRFKNLINQAQTFLFGDQLDLSFILAHKPVMFPHEIPCGDSPGKYLQSLVNIRKDTIKLFKYSDDSNNQENSNKYNIEFRFDCDCDVIIRIHYFASEKYIPNLPASSMSSQLLYVCGCSKFKKCNCLIKDENNEQIIYRRGANILFQRSQHLIIPDSIDFNHWQFNINSNYYPIVIESRPLNEKLAINHAHVTLAYLDRTIHSSNIKNTQNETSFANNNSIYSLQSQLNNSHSYQIKPIKQKQLIDGVLYSLQEIYGIEKKSSDSSDEITKSNNSQQLSDSQTSSSINTSLTATTAANSNASSTMSSSLKKINHDGVSLDSSSKEDDIDEKKRKIEQEIEQELKGIECVICMCETRDTLILPCRHLCLCKMCAINLRIQSNNCPICRIPFIALIQIRLLKKKQFENGKKVSKTTFNTNQLPVLKIENLNILLNEENLIRNEANITDNEIFEENYQIKSEDDNDNFIKKEIIVCNQNIKPRLLDLYEIVTIYEAFNESEINNLNQNENKISKKPKQRKIIKHIPVPIETLNINSNETETISEPINKPIVNNVVSIINNNVESINFKIRNKLPIEIRSSSVLVSQSDTKNSQQKSIRSASYVGNYNSGQQQESIQLGDI